MKNHPVLVAQWITPAGLTYASPAVAADILPGVTTTQLIVISDYAAPETVPLIGDASAGALHVALYAQDSSKLPATNEPLQLEPTGELKVSQYSPDSMTGVLTAPVVVGDALKVAPTAGAPATGASINGTAAASGIIKPANATSAQVIIQNVDAAETLYVSFNDPATTDDIALQPGMSITFNAGIANDIYGLGSGAGAKYSIMELSA